MKLNDLHVKTKLMLALAYLALVVVVSTLSLRTAEPLQGAW